MSPCTPVINTTWGTFRTFPVNGHRVAPGEEHPGLMHDDTFVGRPTPEIDVSEATVQSG